MVKRVIYWTGLHLWPRLPRDVQFVVSRLFAVCMFIGPSRYFIPSYVRRNYPASYDLHRFTPASGGLRYKSFQDFFTRRLRVALTATAYAMWPCDGLLCEVLEVDNPAEGVERVVSVKGELRPLRSVFTPFGSEIPPGYWFSNVFLHNSDYHRIHAPVSGVIAAVRHIPGELRVLRPWAYRKDPSLPALTNERVNVSMLDDAGRYWFLSIVGGPGVATIILADGLKPHRRFVAGEELAAFRLGSTCCMAGPEEPTGVVGLKVRVGDALSVRSMPHLSQNKT